MGATKQMFSEQREKELYDERNENEIQDPYQLIQDRLIGLGHKSEEGNISNLDAVIEMRKSRKKLEDTLNIIKEFESDRLQDIALEAADHKDGYKGYQFEFRNGRKMYSYKNIPDWQEAEKSKKEIEKKYKTMLDAKINGAVHANISEDGEELPLPEISYGKSSLVVKPTRR